jgi:hypothetical protein
MTSHARTRLLTHPMLQQLAVLTIASTAFSKGRYVHFGT